MQRRNYYHRPSPRSSLLEAVLLSLVEEIRFSTTQIDNLGAPVSILLQLSALLAVVGIRDPDPTTDNASSLERSVVALITYPHKRARAHVGITYHAFAIIFLAQPSDGDSWLLTAHD